MATSIELGQTYALAVSRGPYRKGARVVADAFDPELGILVHYAAAPSRRTYVQLSELAAA